MLAQPLPVTTKVTALELSETMFGDGIKVISATYKGDPLSAGIYTDGTTFAAGVVPSDKGIILSTGQVTQFTNVKGDTNQSQSTSSDVKGIDGDKAINTIAGAKTFDAVFLEASFIPEGDTLTMQLVFSSEEYPEWVKSGFNDVVAIWVNGTLLQLSVGDGTISIDNINEKTNPNLYRDNGDGSLNTEMDGLTFVLTLKAPVKPGSENTIKIDIADAGDAIYDSALMIVADSVQTALIAQDDMVTVTTRGEGVVDLLQNDTVKGREGVVISHLADQAVKVGSVVTLGTGEKLLLNADGTVTVYATQATSPVIFSYTITDSTGTSDTAFVSVLPSPVDGTEGDDQMAVGYRDKEGNIIDGIDGLSEVILGYGGNDKITSGFGDDDIYGGTGNDFIRAGDGDDLLEGGAGNDVLDGQAGADRMVGGAGNDVYYISVATDVVIEGAGAGYDKVISDISMTLGANFEELWLREGTSATLANGNELANKIIGNAQQNTMSGFGGIDQLFGEAGADSVSGGAGADLLFGGSGNDLLFGDDGNDKLYGGTGSDSLFGGAGNDSLTAGSDGSWLEGGVGRDLLVGGAGQDVFIFAAGSGRDMVVDFEVGVDRLVLDGIDPKSVKTVFRGDTLLVSWGTTDYVKVDMMGLVSGDLDLFAW
jgi:Ca2+-binding RTX toxin-like protein